MIDALIIAAGTALAVLGAHWWADRDVRRESRALREFGQVDRWQA